MEKFLTKSNLFALAFSLLGLFFPAELRGQDFTGYTSPQTVVQNVFAAQSTPAVTPVPISQTCVPTNGSPCGINNLGQSIHFLTYTVSGTTPCNVDIRLEGANAAGGPFIPISEDGTDNPSQTSPSQGGGVFATGYYAILRANLVSIGNSCTVTATYTGTSATTPIANSIYAASQGYRKFVFNGTNFPGPAPLTNSIRTPAGTTGGRIFLFVSGGGGLANTVVNVTNQIGFGMISQVILSKTITASLTSQTVVLDVPDVPASYLNFSLIPGTNCTTTCAATMVYQFSGAPTEISALSPVLQTSRATSSSFVAETSTTNPGANAQLLNVWPDGTAGAPTTYYEQLVLGSSVAVQVNVVLISTQGSTCTAVTATNLHGNNSGITSTPPLSQVFSSCTVAPTSVRNLYSIFVPAGDTRVIDLTGLLFEPASGGGISIQAAAAVTGTVTASLRFFER